MFAFSKGTPLMAETRRLLGTNLATRAKVFLLIIIILSTSASRSEAQFGYGGFGFGFGFQNDRTDINFLNTWALQNGAAAAAERPRNLVAPFQPRDVGFFERYDLATHEAMINRVARNPTNELRRLNPNRTPSPAPVTQAPVTPTPAPRPEVKPEPRPVVRLADFFGPDRKLVWPIDAPISAGMGEKRRIADQAILAVLNEYQLEGLAHLSNVTEARQRLLDYGRPALDYVRNQMTPAVADSFHSFLLSLYSNIGLAATVARTP
jgi:hypothetical protein